MITEEGQEGENFENVFEGSEVQEMFAVQENLPEFGREQVLPDVQE